MSRVPDDQGGLFLIAAAAEYHEHKTRDAKALIGDIRRWIEGAVKAGADIVVLPAFLGCRYDMLRGDIKSLGQLYENTRGFYLEEMAGLSREYAIHICPGSYWEWDAGHVYHASCILHDGEIIARQRQIYLARWERKLGLSRGTDISLVTIQGWKIGLIVSTDVFYPQVSRTLALEGADAVLCPAAYLGEQNDALQIAGMWQETQQNNFFAIESGYTGQLGELSLWGRSAVYAPLEMTEKEDGFLACNREGKPLISATLDDEKRRAAIARFDVLGQLNRELYQDTGMFTGDRR